MILKLSPAVLALTMAMAAPAHADSVRFHYDAAELSALSSVERLYERLNTRVEAACTTSDRRGLWRRRAEAECFELLLTQFVDRIDDSQLAALHLQASDTRFAIRN